MLETKDKRKCAVIKFTFVSVWGENEESSDHKRWHLWYLSVFTEDRKHAVLFPLNVNSLSNVSSWAVDATDGKPLSVSSSRTFHEKADFDMKARVSWVIYTWSVYRCVTSLVLYQFALLCLNDFLSHCYLPVWVHLLQFIWFNKHSEKHTLNVNILCTSRTENILE